MANLLHRLRPRHVDRDVLTLSRENRRLAAQADGDAELIVELTSRLHRATQANDNAAVRITQLIIELAGVRAQLAARDTMLDTAERDLLALQTRMAEMVSAPHLLAPPAPVVR